MNIKIDPITPRGTAVTHEVFVKRPVMITVEDRRIAAGPIEANGKVALGPVPEICAYCHRLICNTKPRVTGFYADGAKRYFHTTDEFFQHWRDAWDAWEGGK